MLVKILHRFTGTVLFEREAGTFRLGVEAALETGANLSGADLSRADLSGANLSRANLSGADLSRADLSGANLSRANLSRANLFEANLFEANLFEANLFEANLFEANLFGANLFEANLFEANLFEANLSRARGLNPLRVQPLMMLLDQPGPIRAYKLVDADGMSPMHHRQLTYRVGDTIEESNVNTDPNEMCGAGLNVATLVWVMREWTSGWRILVVEHTADDIVCIPTASDGKYRVRRLTVVGEKNLVELGLVDAPAPSN